MKEKRQKQLEAFGRLLDIMDDLGRSALGIEKKTFQLFARPPKGDQ